MTDVIAPPADSPVMNTRRRSMPWSTTIFSIICRIDNASPRPRSMSPGWNQLKQPLGLLDALLLGQQQGEAVAVGECRPPCPVIVACRGLRASVQHDDEGGIGREACRQVAEHSQVAGVRAEAMNLLQTAGHGARVRRAGAARGSQQLLPPAAVTREAGYRLAETEHGSSFGDRAYSTTGGPNGCCSAQKQARMLPLRSIPLS